MMLYRVDYLGRDQFGRLRLRGTGFAPAGGVTWIHPAHLEAMMEAYSLQIEEGMDRECSPHLH